MVVMLDHLILTVNDRDESVRFFTEIMGFAHEGEDGPFSVIRVSPETTLQLAPWGTEGGEHLAFALSPEEFDAAFARVRTAGVPTGTRTTMWATCGAPVRSRGARPGADGVPLRSQRPPDRAAPLLKASNLGRCARAGGARGPRRRGPGE